MLSGGDFWQVGGEFIFESTPSPLPSQAQDGTEKEKGKSRGETKVTWCHRMRNTRDHAEMSEIKSVLGISDAATTNTTTTPAAAPAPAGSDTDASSSADEKLPPKPMKRWSTFSSAGGLGRRMSMKVKRASWAPSKAAAPPPPRTDATTTTEGGERKKPASPGAKDAENERRVLEQLKEEGGAADHQQVDGQGQGGGAEDAMARLTAAVPSSSPFPLVKEGGGEKETAGQNGAVVEHDTVAALDQGHGQGEGVETTTTMTMTDEHKKREGVVLDTGAGTGASAETTSEKEQQQQLLQDEVVNGQAHGLDMGTNGHAVMPAPAPVSVSVA